MMVMQELATMSQYDIPVIVILADNCGSDGNKRLAGPMRMERKNTFGNDWSETENLFARICKK